MNCMLRDIQNKRANPEQSGAQSHETYWVSRVAVNMLATDPIACRDGVFYLRKVREREEKKHVKTH